MELLNNILILSFVSVHRKVQVTIFLPVQALSFKNFPLVDLRSPTTRCHPRLKYRRDNKKITPPSSLLLGSRIYPRDIPPPLGRRLFSTSPRKKVIKDIFVVEEFEKFPPRTICGAPREYLCRPTRSLWTPVLVWTPILVWSIVVPPWEYRCTLERILKTTDIMIYKAFGVSYVLRKLLVGVAPL